MAATSKKVKAWWFEPSDGVLGYGDGRRPEAGATHTVDVAPVLCEAGLHASIRPLDALKYAQSANVWRVELGGRVVRGDDKAAATKRRYLWRIDATEVLRAFARAEALRVVRLWSAPDVVVQYLKTGDESLRDAAWDAARAAARDAAWDAAWDAAGDAGRAAAWATAWARGAAAREGGAKERAARTERGGPVRAPGGGQSRSRCVRRQSTARARPPRGRRGPRPPSTRGAPATSSAARPPRRRGRDRPTGFPLLPGAARDARRRRRRSRTGRSATCGRQSPTSPPARRPR